MSPARATSRRSALLVALLAFVVYLPSIVPGELLCYDDEHYIPASRAVREGRVLQMLDPRASREDLGAEYLPVRDLTYALDAQVWGERTPNGLDLSTPRVARGYRFTNLVVYAIACALACAFVAKLTGDPLLALLAGAFFALHPVHAESAAWVSGRKDVLSGALGFGALLVFLRARETGERGRAALLHSTSAVLGALAMLSKSTLTALPLLVGAVELAVGALRRERARIVGVPAAAPPARPWLARALPIAAHFAVAGLIAWNARAVGLRTGIARPEPPGGLRTVVATDLPILVRYVAESFWPTDLRVSYGRFPFHFSFFEPGVLASALALGAIAGLAVLALARRPKLLAFAAAWLVLGLVPVLNLVPFVQLIADRYLFVPVLGPCVLAAWAIVRARRSRAAPLVAAIALVATGALAVSRGLDFATSERLFRSNVALEPENALAHHELGRALLGGAEKAAARGEPGLAAAVARAAIVEERQAIRLYLRPNVLWAGHLEEAQHSLARALEISGDRAGAAAVERSTLEGLALAGSREARAKLGRLATKLLLAARSPGDLDLALEAARGFASIGDDARAHDALERARFLDPAGAADALAHDPRLRAVDERR